MKSKLPNELLFMACTVDAGYMGIVVDERV